jgi:hypothetical protein
MHDASRISSGNGHVDVTARVGGHATQEFEIASEATLLDVMERAATLAGVALLPPMERPFDHIHEMNGDCIGTGIEFLDQTLAEYLRRGDRSPHFAIELALAIRVNTRWDVAPETSMSPRQILSLPRIHLDHKEFTLYLPDSTAPLPLDTPIRLERGIDLEAQRDGKYGGTR